MLHLEQPNYKRSIAVPPRDSLGLYYINIYLAILFYICVCILCNILKFACITGMYLEFKSRTGENIEETSFKTFLRRFGPNSGVIWQPPLTNLGLIAQTGSPKNSDSQSQNQDSLLIWTISNANYRRRTHLYEMSLQPF